MLAELLGWFWANVLTVLPLFHWAFSGKWISCSRSCEYWYSLPKNLRIFTYSHVQRGKYFSRNRNFLGLILRNERKAKKPKVRFEIKMFQIVIRMPLIILYLWHFKISLRYDLISSKRNYGDVRQLGRRLRNFLYLSFIWTKWQWLLTPLLSRTMPKATGADSFALRPAFVSFRASNCETSRSAGAAQLRSHIGTSGA